MAWGYYSYYNLIRKDAGFDCVKYLACYGRFSTFVRTSSSGPYWAVRYGLVPVAEIAPGVFIRCDALTGSKTASPALTPTLYDFTQHAGGRYYFELRGTGSNFTNLFRSQVAETTEVETLTSNTFPYRITRRHYYYDTQNPGANTETNPATYDATPQIVTANCDVIVADIQNNIKTQFESDFSGNLFNLDASFTFSEAVTISPGTSNVSFDPITAPLFRIDFI